MGRLIYMAIASLDGYVADEDGRFEWSAPDEEVHAFVNDLERPVGTQLLGRRMYEVLSAWETMEVEGEPDVIRDFAAIWRGADKVVYSRTLETVSTARTRLEREFDPEAVRQMKASAQRDLSIGGPELAGAGAGRRAGGRDPPAAQPGDRRRRNAGAARRSRGSSSSSRPSAASPAASSTSSTAARGSCSRRRARGRRGRRTAPGRRPG